MLHSFLLYLSLYCCGSCCINRIYISKLIIFLQSQVESYKCENERLQAGESAALHTMKQNAHVASEYLHKVTQDAENSIKYVEIFY